MTAEIVEKDVSKPVKVTPAPHVQLVNIRHRQMQLHALVVQQEDIDQPLGRQTVLPVRLENTLLLQRPCVQVA